VISKFFTEKEVSGVFGFDLGTTNSVVTTFTSEGLPTPLVTDSGSITPSCVQFCKNGSIKIGKEAYNNKHLPEVVYSFKKYMGTQYCFKIPGGGEKTAKEVSTIFVREMMSQVYMHQPELVGIKDIVISTPAYFNINQTGDTKSVFTDLGYNVIAIQPEPTSAALVFQTLKNLYEDVLVFDLGGGTFDAVYIRNQNGFPKDSIRLYENAGYNLPELERLLEVVDISGDNALGGDNIDELAVKYYKK
jgi:molecular chaperone HscC